MAKYSQLVSLIYLDNWTRKRKKKGKETKKAYKNTLGTLFKPALTLIWF